MRIAGYSVFLFCFIPTLLIAQSQIWEGGVYTGGINYTGDLVRTSLPNPKETNTWLGFYLSRHLKENLYLQAHLGTGEISGDDRNYADRKLRSFYFTTQITEVYLNLQWHPFFKTGQKSLPFFSPYGFGGLGLFHLSPKATLNRAKLPDLRDAIAFDQSNLPGKIQPCLPFGAGFEVKLNSKIQLGLEAGFRLTFTDYLDGVSHAGNPEGNDWYGTLGLKFGYKFGKSDLDKDGIVDYKDACPNQPGLATHNGCPDTDGDGIADINDICPNVPGTRQMGGCPDRDNDGIADQDDICPDIAGLIQLRGCPPIDTDGDGIADTDDPCPLHPGPVERLGCPPTDSDEDGLLDEDDKCPGEYGLAIFDGCPDTDGDGIEDAQDKCPTLFGLYSQQGCPLQIRPEDEAAMLNRQMVIFPSGTAEIERYSLLDNILDFLKTYPNYQLLIKGYSDIEGNNTENLQLSTRRARACYDYLRSQGIPSGRMEFKGYGSGYPISENTSEKGRQQNRRVEFQLFR
ncbi:MAG: DUF6089 family protein [Saprospiraceae bacterium]